MNRAVDSLGVSEREMVWQSLDPIWPALYCWHDGCWWYATKDAPYWRESVAGAEAVANGVAGFVARTEMTDALFEYGAAGTPEDEP